MSNDIERGGPRRLSLRAALFALGLTPLAAMLFIMGFGKALGAGMTVGGGGPSAREVLEIRLLIYGSYVIGGLALVAAIVSLVNGLRAWQGDGRGFPVWLVVPILILAGAAIFVAWYIACWC